MSRLRHTLGPLLASSAPAIVAIVASCGAPTEITFAISTDVRCADLRGTTVAVGPLDDLEGRPPTASSASCVDSGDLGTLVVVPSGDRGSEVAVRIVAGLGRDPD